MQRYSNWVMNHPAGARQVEQLARIGVFMACNPTSIVALEGGQCANTVLTYVNNGCLKEYDERDMIGKLEPGAGTLDKILSVALDTLRTLQVWIELLTRQRLGHRRGWQMVVLLQGVYALVTLLLQRVYLRRTLSSFSRVLWRTLTATRRSPSSQTAGRIPRTGGPRLVIPRIGVLGGKGGESLDETVVGTSAWDYLAFALQLFYWLRPLILALAASRLQRQVKADLGKRFTWELWGGCLAAEAVAAALSALVRSNQPPVALVSTGGAVPSTTAESSCAQAATPKVDDEMLGNRVRLLGRSLLREPFFGLVLRGFIQKHIADGFVARYIPVVGTILRLTTEYFLEIQRRSYLFSIGHSPA